MSADVMKMLDEISKIQTNKFKEIDEIYSKYLNNINIDDIIKYEFSLKKSSLLTDYLIRNLDKIKSEKQMEIVLNLIAPFKKLNYDMFKVLANNELVVKTLVKNFDSISQASFWVEKLIKVNPHSFEKVLLKNKKDLSYILNELISMKDFQSLFEILKNIKNKNLFDVIYSVLFKTYHGGGETQEKIYTLVQDIEEYNKKLYTYLVDELINDGRYMLVLDRYVKHPTKKQILKLFNEQYKDCYELDLDIFFSYFDEDILCMFELNELNEKIKKCIFEKVLYLDDKKCYCELLSKYYIRNFCESNKKNENNSVFWENLKNCGIEKLMTLDELLDI